MSVGGIVKVEDDGVKGFVCGREEGPLVRVTGAKYVPAQQLPWISDG